MALLVNAEHDQEKVVMYHSGPKYWNRNACTNGDSPDQLLLGSSLIRASLAQGLEIVYIWLLINFLSVPFFLLCASL